MLVRTLEKLYVHLTVVPCQKKGTLTEFHDTVYIYIYIYIYIGCVPPQVALAFASRMIACSCDMQAPQPTADDASGLRLSSIVSLFTGYAALAHLRAPFDWLQHANGVVSFWGARFGVDGDGVLQSLKVRLTTALIVCHVCCDRVVLFRI
jgi:hypothetical protein